MRGWRRRSAHLARNADGGALRGAAWRHRQPAALRYAS